MAGNLSVSSSSVSPQQLGCGGGGTLLPICVSLSHRDCCCSVRVRFRQNRVQRFYGLDALQRDVIWNASSASPPPYWELNLNDYALPISDGQWKFDYLPEGRFDWNSVYRSGYP